ncbi:MAG: hypothetical protein ACFCUR_01785 [Rhodomicrobiaceae bacterium]
MSKPRMKIRHVILCDDVRREDNGKLLAIGVYPKDIVFSKLPADFALTVWLETQQEELGEIPFNLRGHMGNADEVLFELRGTAKVAKVQPYAQFIVGFPMLIGSEGDLIIEFRQHDDDWEELRRMPVIKMPISSSAQKQPA